MKAKSYQIIRAFLLLVASTVIAILCLAHEEGFVWYWVLGLAFGYVMQRSAICFNAMANEPLIVGFTSQFRAILIGILVSSIGIAALKYLSGGMLDFTGVSTISLPLAAGAFIFGIGMILAGCCTSGMFIRMAEGFTVHIITLVCVVIGYLFAGSHYQEVWSRFVIDAPAVFLPDKLGWFWGVASHIAIILLLYTAAVKWENKKLDE